MLKKLIAPAVAGGILAGSLAVGGTAFAATPAPTTTTHATHAGARAAHRWLRAHRKGLRAGGADHQRHDHRHHAAGAQGGPEVGPVDRPGGRGQRFERLGRRSRP